MSGREMQIEVITYEKERLEYFADLMKKAQKKYNRLFKKFKDAPVLSAYHEILCNAGRESNFYADVVEMLEKGYRKQIECEDVSRWRGVFECSVCHWTDEDIGTADPIRFCAGCGAKVKGGA